jgi:6-phosphogluconolactonase
MTLRFKSSAVNGLSLKRNYMLCLGVRRAPVILGVLITANLNAQLTENCTVSVLNRNIQVKPDGTWVLANIPVNQGRVRARAICMENGATRFGQSNLFTITQNGSIDVPPITLGVVTPIPSLVSITPPPAALQGDFQLSTRATYPDGANKDITPASAGTNYTTSNAGVASVSADGLIHPIASGAAVITAFNEGTSGSVSIRVGIAPAINITSPVSGATVTEGAIVPVTITTTGTVAFVKFLVNNQVVFTTTSKPYNFSFTVPLGILSVILGAQADDGFSNIGVAQPIPINVTADPRTTVTGRVLDSTAQPVPGVAVNALNEFTGTTLADGTFSIPGVLTSRGNIAVSASINIAGVLFSGMSASVAPVVAGTTNVGNIVLSRSGRFIYTAAYQANGVFQYTLNANTGALILIPGSPFPAGNTPYSIETDPLGQFVFVANLSSNNVSTYTVNSGTGSLTPVVGSPFSAGSGTRALAVDPTGRFLYAANEGSNNISAYKINAPMGSLTVVLGSPFPAGSNPQGIAVDATGRFVYVANTGSNTVSAFSINQSTGALIPVPGSPFAAGTSPVAMAANAAFVYATNYDSGNVSAYAIDTAGGALTPVAGSPFFSGIQPGSIVLHQNGRFAYVGNAGGNNTSGFSIDSTTGALTSLTGSPFSDGRPGDVHSVIIDQTGQFLIGPRTVFDSIQVYRIDTLSGVLSRVPGSPFPAGPGPVSATAGNVPSVPDLSAISCTQESSLRSISGATATSIAFLNASSQTRNVYWLDYGGQRVLYSTLPTGLSYLQGTFLTHPWLITDSAGQCLNIYMPVSGIGRVIIEQ